jgi:hypothetical protein
MAKNTEFEFIMISAMFENGGNVTQRSLDGHPELHVYPFESQLGNSVFVDHLSSLFPFRYRWPEFPANGNPADDYELFFDEEVKARLRTPARSKFKDADIKLDESERKKIFLKLLKDKPRTRANIIEAFFRSTFDAWKNFNRSGKERIYVGYSPIIGIDGDRIIADFPHGHVIHVVRNPYSAYAETRYRPYPWSIHRYTVGWNLVQHMALMYAESFPNNFHILRYEDLIKDTKKTMTDLCKKIGINFSDKLLYPSWNGLRMKEVYPWGTILFPTEEENRQRLNELSTEEKSRIRTLSKTMLKALAYE